MTFSIIPRRVYETVSPFSGKIVVEEQLGLYSLSVQNLIQSGGWVKTIWKKPLKRLTSHVSPITNVLLLGLGGGTVAWLIKNYWPQTKIVGVEIDPEIIKISKKYFGLDNVPGLQIVNADAFDYIKKAKQKFDLIIVDLYLGRKFPKKAESEEFFREIKKILTPKGIVIFNRLKIEKGDLSAFEQELKNYFSSVELVKTSTNLFFLGYNSFKRIIEARSAAV